MLVAIPQYRTRESIADYLSLPLNKVSEALEFLLSVGIVVERLNEYRIGPTHIHLGNDSENIQKHHTNWRLQAMNSLNDEDDLDLHYSVLYTLAAKDVAKVKERLIRTIKEILDEIEPSPEEVLYCQTIDFFQLRKK